MTLRQLLGIELPIIQAPMAGVQGSALAVAVSNAGGLGSLPCALLSPDAMRRSWRRSRRRRRSRLTSTSSATRRPRPVPERDAAWRAALSPYYQEFGIDPDTIPAGAGPSAVRCRGRRLLAEFRPAVVSFHFGLPSRGIAGTGEEARLEDPLVGDDRGRGAVARSARGRRHHRAGSRGRRTPRHVPVGRPDDPGRHAWRWCRRSCRR